MRFITEFEITEAEVKYARYPVVEYRKQHGEANMGKLISESFDWSNPVNEDGNRFRLCIEAFPDAKWIEFKNNLMDYLTECDISEEIPETLKVLKLIKELESFGKPAAKQLTDGTE